MFKIITKGEGREFCRRAIYVMFAFCRWQSAGPGVKMVTHQLLGMGKIGWRAYVDPSAGYGEIGHFEASGNGGLYQVSCIRALVGFQRSQQRVGYDVYACIGII